MRGNWCGIALGKTNCVGQFWFALSALVGYSILNINNEDINKEQIEMTSRQLLKSQPALAGKQWQGILWVMCILCISVMSTPCGCAVQKGKSSKGLSLIHI